MTYEINDKTDRHKESQTDKQTDKRIQIHKQTDRKTVRHTDKQLLIGLI